MKPPAAILFAALLPLAPARAALIDVGSPLGQATAVLDTSTGLEWLKLSAPAGATPDQILAQLVNLRNTEPANHRLVRQVPEPSSLALIGIAAFALAMGTWRTRRTYGCSSSGTEYRAPRSRV